MTQASRYKITGSNVYVLQLDYRIVGKVLIVYDLSYTLII
jgi:hypothetical protein